MKGGALILCSVEHDYARVCFCLVCSKIFIKTIFDLKKTQKYGEDRVIKHKGYNKLTWFASCFFVFFTANSKNIQMKYFYWNCNPRTCKKDKMKVINSISLLLQCIHTTLCYKPTICYLLLISSLGADMIFILKKCRIN